MESLCLHNISLTTNIPLHLWEDVMETLYITNKGSIVKTLEKFHIYNLTRLDNQINDKSTVKYNAIFDTIVHKNSYREH
jgi:hypothetical protein